MVPIWALARPPRGTRPILASDGSARSVRDTRRREARPETTGTPTRVPSRARRASGRVSGRFGGVSREECPIAGWRENAAHITRERKCSLSFADNETTKRQSSDRRARDGEALGGGAAAPSMGPASGGPPRGDDSAGGGGAGGCAGDGTRVDRPRDGEARGSADRRLERRRRLDAGRSRDDHRPTELGPPRGRASGVHDGVSGEAAPPLALGRPRRRGRGRARRGRAHRARHESTLRD